MNTSNEKSMKCPLCDARSITIEYDGLIRDGGLGNYTPDPVKMFRCENCGVIWHEPFYDNSEYYESTEYREALENTSDEQEFYNMHDKENMAKLLYCGGTGVFRNKTVADIGCGCGSFLDLVNGAAGEVVAVEPSRKYRMALERKGYSTYGYAKEAFEDYADRCDMITSFDVIEHVEDPKDFLSDYYKLLNKDGIGIIGTPTEAPVMRELLGEIYEKTQLFSTQHLWVFNEKSLRRLADITGFTEVNVKYFQRYGIGNMMGWLRDKKPRSNLNNKFITDTMDDVWKRELEARGLSDYIVLYVRK